MFLDENEQIDDTFAAFQAHLPGATKRKKVGVL
jgi:hypothetical protein